jgi:Protein of unknown function (DUF2934)
MPTKSQRTGNARREANSTQAATPRNSVRNLSPEEEIRRHTYEIYLARGDQPGSALDDWLQAEREVQQRDQLAKKEHDEIRANR